MDDNAEIPGFKKSRKDEKSGAKKPCRVGTMLI
jgi:hypothetical protein